MEQALQGRPAVRKSTDAAMLQVTQFVYWLSHSEAPYSD